MESGIRTDQSGTPDQVRFLMDELEKLIEEVDEDPSDIGKDFQA